MPFIWKKRCAWICKIIQNLFTVMVLAKLSLQYLGISNIQNLEPSPWAIKRRLFNATVKLLPSATYKKFSACSRPLFSDATSKTWTFSITKSIIMKLLRQLTKNSLFQQTNKWQNFSNFEKLSALESISNLTVDNHSQSMTS